MKIIWSLPLAASLMCLSCGEEKPTTAEPADAQESTSPLVAPAEASLAATRNADGFNAALGNVVPHLDTDGVHFSVTHVDKDVTEMASVIDGVLDMARKTSDEIPPNLNVADLVDDLGLSRVVAMGRSAKKSQTGWHNRMFLETGGKKTGVLSLLGAEGATWRSQEIAPSDVDLVLEFELNLRRMKQTIDVVTSSFGEEPKKQFMQAMQEKVANSALTVGDFLGKMDVRASLMVSLDSDKRWSPSESVELPYLDCTLCIDRGLWIWENFGEEIEANAEVSERDGLRIVKAPKEMNTPMGKIRPIIILDKEKDVIWLSLREEYLNKCMSGGDKLSSDRSYQAATAGFPEKGNGLFFVSRDFCKEISLQLNEVKNKLPKGGEAEGAFDTITGLLGGSLSVPDHGYAWCVANTETGILTVGNSPFPNKGYSMTGSVGTVAALAAMATPVIMKAQKKAQTVQAVSNMKQFFYLLVEYDQDEGAFPKRLSDLVKDGYIKQESYTELNMCQVDGEKKPLIYISGYSTSDDFGTIILHTPAPIDGKRAFLRIDGAVKTVPESEFQRLLKQNKK